MKSFILAAVAALATAVVAAPAAQPNANAVAARAAAAVPTPATSGSGQLLTDLGPEVNGVLTVTGQDAKQLLIQLSPEVAALLTGLGLPSLGVPVGSIVATASSVGDLVKDLGPNTQGLLTVLGGDGSFLLVQLAPSVAALVSGLGLPSVGIPVGTIVATVGSHVKRQATGDLLHDIGKQVNGILTVTGPDAKKLLIQLSPEVAALLIGLGLPGVGVPVGEIVASAASVGDLLKNLGPQTEGLLTVIGEGGKVLLIQLSPGVAGLLTGLGLPSVGIPVGTVVATLGANL